MPHLTTLPWALLLFAAIIGYPLIAPLHHRSPESSRPPNQSIKVEYVPIELTQLPLEVTHPFFRDAGWLASCGFTALGHVTRLVANTRQNAFSSVWTNASNCDSAQIIGVTTPSKTRGQKVAALVGFRTEFTDGTSISTSNMINPTVFPRDPRVSSVRCRDVYDIALLYQFHRARVERDRGKRTPTLEKTQDAAGRLVYEHHDTHDRLVKAGYYTIDHANQNYVPTYKGCYLMTYRLLRPFKQIQIARRDRLAGKTLRELGFGGLTEFQSAQRGAPSQPLKN